VPGTPLHKLIQHGKYVESTEKEKLEEAKEFVRCLTNNTVFMTEHASNLFHVECRLPDDKEQLMAYIQQIIDGKDEKDLRRYREYITRAF